MTTETNNIAKENAIITEDNIDTFKLLNLQSQRSDLKRLADDTLAKQKEFANMFSDTEVDVDFIDERIANFTVDDINKLSDDEINNICISPDTGEGVLELDDANRTTELRRDYLIFRKETNDALAGIDAEMEKLNAAYAEYEEDIAKINASYGDITEYLKHTLEEKANNATSEESAQRFRDMIKTIDLAMSLDNMVEYYSKPYNARCAVTNIKSPNKGPKTIKNYEKVISEVSCKTDFRRYGNIQEKFLPDGYNNRYPDVFMYSLINYIASWAKNEDNVLNGLFLAQFSINLKNLVYNKFSKEEDKQTFISSICKVIDLVD